MLKAIRRPSSFVRQAKKLGRKHYDLNLLEQAMHHIMQDDRDLLTTKYRDHALTGNLSGLRELHIQCDWLLIYRTHLPHRE